MLQMLQFIMLVRNLEDMKDKSASAYFYFGNWLIPLIFVLLTFIMENISENELIHTAKFTVTSADTDMFSRLKTGALANFLIQSAIQSADKLGFGFRNIREQQLFWVLSRLTIHISRPLKWYDEVEVETWPKDVDKILYLRDFIIRTKQGEIVAKATSGWLAIDLASKRPKKIEGLHAGFFTHLREKQAITDLPEKVPVVHEGENFKLLTTYNDIDLNKHVTATRYIDWMMDTFPVDFHDNYYPRELVINYIKETMPGEQISLLKSGNETSGFIFGGTNQTSNTVAFRGRVEFQN